MSSIMPIPWLIRQLTYGSVLYSAYKPRIPTAGQSDWP
ncbi:hypothetical protein ATL31_2551 [Phycicoccus duodecadis]|uniref:Uncharacterized protein n=1 Tax=Phycicoccus duodecadis TaxID=173053 RepID=A0A2N3YLH0_9MICO|nr:hypothetical protein ATL31_2551 [Phycicoccus duodecadis]